MVEELQSNKEGLIVVVVLHQHFADNTPFWLHVYVIKVMLATRLVNLGPRVVKDKLESIIVVANTNDVPVVRQHFWELPVLYWVLV
jgi:hypothetical protein